MTPERWAAVNSIFHDVADLPFAERTRALEVKSGGDLEITAAVKDLLLADTSDSYYLEIPAAQSPEFQQLLTESQDVPLLHDGDLLCDRFRIVRLIGEGGMGQVYEALDEELNVRIALKVIRPEIAAEENVTRRFRHEVRLARSITHTNVCRTFDLERGVVRRAAEDSSGVPGELMFLTMEYVDGETLAALLSAKGALPAEEALSIAEQIAAGIDSAHEHGVIHRDLKPQNILLSKSTTSGERCQRAVITDFGLARLGAASIPSADHSSSSHEAQAAGTLAYMSPEQIRGRHVDSSTDIYSFGLLLFEMVTGQRAFPRESFLHDLGARFGAEPPSARALNPEIPEGWDDVIRRCLSLQPESRYHSAAEVIAAIRGDSSFLWLKGLQIRRNVRWQWISRRLLAGVAAAAIAVSCFVEILRYRQVETPRSNVAQGALVYMPAVRNETGNPRLNDVAPMMAAALAQSSQVAVLDQSAEAATLQRMLLPVAPVLNDTTAREVALRAGASRVVLVTLRKEGELLRLTAEVQKPEANTPTRPRNKWARSWTCAMPDLTSAAVQDGTVPADLLHIVRDAADWIRQTVGEAKEDIATFNAPVEELTTMNWEALSEYARAERLHLQNKSDDAILTLQNAVHNDPGFALGWSRMGDILFSVGRDAEGIRAYKNALDAGDQRRLTLLERDRLRGLIAIDTWDYETAENMFHDATVNYSDDFLSLFYRGSMLIQLDRLPEAIGLLSRARKLRPENASTPITLASAYLISGMRTQAMQIAADERVKGHLADALWLEAEDHWLVGDLALASHLLAEIDPRSELHASAIGLLVRIDLQESHTSDALRLLDESIEQDRQNGELSRIAFKQMDRAYIECSEARVNDCIQDIDRSLAASPSPGNFGQAAEALTSSLSAKLPAAQALRIQAAFRRIIAAAPGSEFGLSSDIVKMQLQAGLLLSRGKTTEAIRVYRKSANLDPPIVAGFTMSRALLRAALLQPAGANRTALEQEAAQSLGNEPQKMRAFLWYLSAASAPGDFLFAHTAHP